MDISVVVPFYKGNDYLPRLLKSLVTSSARANQLGITTEIIIVNDSPEIEVLVPEQYKNSVCIITNERNRGIQYSRINGLKKAKGIFILFIDQDDELTPQALISNYNEIGMADVVIGNGNFVYKDKKQESKRLIYLKKRYQKKAASEIPYLYVRDLIVSPGHCLIRKSAIPQEWKDNIMKKNGADDYLLWLLMFNNERKFSVNYDVVYIHHDSGENLSFNVKNMKQSFNELISILNRDENYPSKSSNVLERQYFYKSLLVERKIFLLIMRSIIDPVIFIYNLYFRLFYGGNVISAKEMNSKN